MIKGSLKFMSLVSLAVVLFFSTPGCGGSSAPTGNDTSINTLDGATGIPVDSTFTYTFSKAANSSTITGTSFFILPTPASVAAQSAGKAAYDASICDATQALPASISHGSTTESTLDPTNNLNYNTRYTVCLTSEIKHSDGEAFPGVMAHFTTEKGGTAATYTVGGTVSGLVGTVVLQNNGGDDLSITENGTFTFATALDDAATYSVTVLTQPTERSCAVSNGSGTINAANITDVSVTCRYWSNPSNISDNISPDGEDAQYPRAAMDADDNTLILWEQSDGLFSQIFKSEYRNGAWLPHPSSLTDDHISLDGQNAEEPDLAMDDNGNAIIVWRQSDGAHDRIYKCEYRNGAWCTTPDIVSLATAATSAYEPRVAMDNNGNAIVAWKLNDSGGNNQIFVSEYRNGVWTIPGNIDDNLSPNGQDAAAADVAISDNGDAVVVWEQNDGAFTQIFKAEYRNNGPWTVPSGLSDNLSPDTKNAYGARVAMDDYGNTVVVWEQSDGSDLQVFKAEYRNSGPWTIPAGLSDNVSPNGQPATGPGVAMGHDGDALIVWTQKDGTNFHIFTAEYWNGGPWVTPSGLDDRISLDGKDAATPLVAMDNNGNALIVWTQDNGSHFQIYKAEYRDGGPWQTPSDFTDKLGVDGEHTYEPDMAMSDGGDAIIVWQENNGVNHQIFMSEYR